MAVPSTRGAALIGALELAGSRSGNSRYKANVAKRPEPLCPSDSETFEAADYSGPCEVFYPRLNMGGLQKTRFLFLGFIYD